MRYRYNPSCSCSRCRTHGFMGPAVLIALGVLFLLDQVSRTHWLRFWDSTWPALLIVIGLVMFLEHNASSAGHVPREYGAMPPPAPGGPAYPGQPQPPAVASPPASANWNPPENPEVHHG